MNPVKSPKTHVGHALAKTLSHEVSRSLLRTLLRTVSRDGLIEKDDRILVAVSGGKDSYTLLHLLCEAQKRAPFRFELVAVHIDQGQPGYDGVPLQEWLAAFGAPYEIVKADTYSVVKKLTQPGETYCAPCSRMRRGVLYTTAERLGCRKIALGHHREDTLQTLLLNLLYAGKLQAMPAQYTTDDGRFRVIRPLVDCAERDIAEHARLAGYPLLPCNLCGSQDGQKRKHVEKLLRDLEQTIPDVRQVMLHALKNVRPSHLLDVDVAAAWAERRPDLRPDLRRNSPARHLPVVD